MTTGPVLHPDPERRMDRTLVVVGRGLDPVVASRLLPPISTMAGFLRELVEQPEDFLVEGLGMRIVRRSDEAVMSRTDSRDERHFRYDRGIVTLRVMDHRLDVSRRIGVLVQCAAVVRIAMERIVAGDRIVSEKDFAVTADCAAEDVIGPHIEPRTYTTHTVDTSLLDGFRIGTPWYPGRTDLHAGHPRAHDARTLHWTLARDLSALGVWMLDGRLTMGPISRRRMDRPSDPIDRMRRSAQDTETLARVEAMGLLDGGTT